MKRQLRDAWRMRMTRWAGWACCLALLGGSSCSLRPQAARPVLPVDVPTQFSRGSAAGQAVTPAGAMPEAWWDVFQTSQLNGFVEEALRDNLTLKQRWNRLAQAEALARKAGAGRWPSLTGETSAGRSRTHTETGGQSRTTLASSFALGLSASYEVDLWGRVRNTHAAAGRTVSASRLDVQTAALTTSAEVVLAWAQIVQSQANEALLQEQIKTNQAFLELVVLRFKNGQTTAVDVLQQQQILEATRAGLPPLRMARALQQHRLSVLLGNPPGEAIAIAATRLPGLPASPAVGVPMDLLQRRPDVQAAYERVMAANHKVAAAIADRFPALRITTRAESSATRTRDLFDNWLANLLAGLSAPVLDGGMRAAEVDVQKAAAAEALHAYGQAVLVALREMEDALAQERGQALYLKSIRTQLQTARQKLQTARAQYLAGKVSYLSVLEALGNTQSLERSLLNEELNQFMYRISLYRALAGGVPWQDAHLADILIGTEAGE